MLNRRTPAVHRFAEHRRNRIRPMSASNQFTHSHSDHEPPRPRNPSLVPMAATLTVPCFAKTKA